MIAARPLTIGDIFDRTVTIMVQRWRIVVAIGAIDATPTALITAFTRGHDTAGPALALGMVVALLIGALTFSVLVRLGGDPDAPDDIGALLRKAAHDYWRSLGSFVLIYIAMFVVLAVAGIIVFGAAAGARAVAGPAGSVAAAVVVALLMALLLLPFFVMTSVAYANVILEGVDPWGGLTSGVSRGWQAGLPRTWLLSAALLIVSLLPSLVIDSVTRPFADASGMWWLLLAEPYIIMVTGVTFGTIAGAVAAVDYRNRREGADLRALFDQSVSA